MEIGKRQLQVGSAVSEPMVLGSEPYTRIEQFQACFLDRLTALHGIGLAEATPWQQYTALAAVVRERIGQDWVQTRQQVRQQGSKQVYYLSIEFLLGRLLGANLLNLGLYTIADTALRELGICLAELEQQEPDAGLGNGGLGRLAACYLDSMASARLAGQGCGLRYRYGLFEQHWHDRAQVECPDHWLQNGYVWEYQRPEQAVEVCFGRGLQAERVRAVPYDIPVIGFENQVVNTLRLWSAEAVPAYPTGRLDYDGALWAGKQAAAITDQLYPDDSSEQGKRLRLKQQYLLVAASLASIVREYQAGGRPLTDLSDYVAIHINDTHPALAVPELMRLLTDQEGVDWETAWQVTVHPISYTNHTVLPEALERWPAELFKDLLPRMYELVYEINERFCQDLWNRFPGEWDKIGRMAVIADGAVHMAHLAIAGSHSVNGVAKLHTEILKTQAMKDFADFYPGKFNNKTNGVTHRRWLMKANPGLSRLITQTIGPDWQLQPDRLADLAAYARDGAFQHELAQVKRVNKAVLARYIHDHYGLTVSLDSIFDVQIKRIHAYKRQLLNALHILFLYNRLKAQPDLNIAPRTFIFGGKAAASYAEAKKTIQLINTLAAVINQDRTVRDQLKVVYLENYQVSLAELIIPAADVSEQISTAGKEASGTGNMKLMMNGAVTIGTLDGANVEIQEAVGEDNLFIFGLTAGQVADYLQYGGYSSRELYRQDERIGMVADQLINGFFPVDRDEFALLYQTLLAGNDPFFVLKDFAAYTDAQERLQHRFQDTPGWLRMAALNIAHAGRFAIDRTFAEYARDIWSVEASGPQQGQSPGASGNKTNIFMQ